MRSVLAFLLVLSMGPAVAGPADDFAQRLAGPWGRVDQSWRPLIGALSKNSCPPGGVKGPETIGLFGDGGAMWIEPALAGAIKVYDGGPAPQLFSFVEMSGAGAAIYDDASRNRSFTLTASGLTKDRVPSVPGLPATNFVRCLKKK